MRGLPSSWIQPSDGSLLGRARERRVRHPEEFDCAIRVVHGHVPGLTARWRYRRSAVDPLETAFGEVELSHGELRLRLRFTGEVHRPSGLVHRHHVVWPAHELDTGATVEVAADVGEAARLRLLPP